MDIPKHGEVIGPWDLRGREEMYLGNIELAGKRILEIGTASGHLCFWMERQDVQERKKHVKKINNSWWYAHERVQSRARVAYGTVYDLPPRLGHFDIVTLGAILLHLRDPFLAMQRAASVADTVVVTDLPLPPREQTITEVFGNNRVVKFLPDAGARSPWETWWTISPDFVAEVLKILGCRKVAFSRHHQRYMGQEMELYTVVGRRGSAENTPGNEALSLSDRDLALVHRELLAAIPGRRVLNHVVGRMLRRLRLRH